MDAIKLDPEEEWRRASLYLSPQGYVLHKAKLLHRLLMGNPAGKDVDHINGDILDNRKDNLRAVSRSINNMNSPAIHSSSGYRGVIFHRASGRWTARLKHNGRVLSLGYHKTPEEANRIRLLKEMEVFGVQPRRRQFFVDAGILSC